MADATAVKKKPGRPPKKRVDGHADQIRGVVDAPENPMHSLELIYRDPQLFKGIVSLLRQYNINDIEIKFDRAEIKIEAIDRLRKTRVYAAIDGRAMNSYFCKEPVKVCVKCETFDLVLSTVLRNHGKINFCLRSDNSRSVLYCFVRDSERSANNVYSIEALFKPEDSLFGVTDDDSQYPLKFKFDSKYLKTLCQNVAKFTDRFTIQKDGESHLQFTYNQPHLMDGNIVYDNATNISLKSTLAPDDIISVTVSVATVEPISKNLIGDDVSIAIDKVLPMSFTSAVCDDDGRQVAVVKVFNDLRTL